MRLGALVGFLIIFLYNPTSIQPEAYFQEVEAPDGDISGDNTNDNGTDSDGKLWSVDEDSLAFDDDNGEPIQNYPSVRRFLTGVKITAYCLRGLTRSETYTTYGT